ncbi:MAG: hypothetical protein JXJ04_21225 [Spirochaetales bacterium]|nr:hypothetical protein [Spirochaetales bacterium]
MGSIIPESSVILRWLIDYSIDTSLIIGLIFVIRFITKKLPAWWHYSLWLILLLFMLVPLKFEKPVSIPEIVPASVGEKLSEFIFIEEEVVLPGFRKETSLNPQRISLNQLNPQIQNLQNHQGRHFPVSDILLFIWLAASISFGTYTLIKNIRFWNSIKKEPLLNEKEVLNLMGECNRRMGSHTPIAIVITDKVKSPALFGCIHPMLLLPVGILEKLDEKELSYIFMHELGHLKRHDVAMAWLTMFLQAIHWFNPLVWFSFHIMRIDQESACDDFVLSRIRPEQSRDYGISILGFLDKFRPNRKGPAMAGIIESKSQIKRRMSMIINFRKYSKRKKILTSILLILICLVFFSITGFSKDNQKPEEFVSSIIKEISLEHQKYKVVPQVSDIRKENNTDNKKVQPVVQDKDNERVNKAEELTDKNNKLLIAARDNEVKNKKEEIKPAEVIEKAPIENKNKDMKNEIDSGEENPEITDIQIKPQDKTYKINTTYKSDKNLSQKYDEPQDKPLQLDPYGLIIQLPQTNPRVRAASSVLHRAHGFFSGKKYSEARDVIVDYLANKSNSEEVLDGILYYMLASTWLIEGKREKGREVLKEGYELTLDKLLLQDYAFVSYETGHYEDASQLYERLYDESEDKAKDARLLEYAAQSNIKLKNWEEAKRIYKKMIDLPGNPEQRWLKNIITLCKRLNQTEEAEDYTKQFQELYGNDG